MQFESKMEIIKHVNVNGKIIISVKKIIVGIQAHVDDDVRYIRLHTYTRRPYCSSHVHCSIWTAALKTIITSYKALIGWLLLQIRHLKYVIRVRPQSGLWLSTVYQTIKASNFRQVLKCKFTYCSKYFC